MLFVGVDGHNTSKITVMDAARRDSEAAASGQLPEQGSGGGSHCYREVKGRKFVRFYGADGRLLFGQFDMRPSTMAKCL